MLSIVLILFIWTWGLTPLWVNVVATILLFIRFTFRTIKLFTDIVKGPGKENPKPGVEDSEVSAK